MVVVYLKNGEKAPLPDANRVKLESGLDGKTSMLQVLDGDRESGLFKWEEVAGYAIQVLDPADFGSPPQAYSAWGVRGDH